MSIYIGFLTSAGAYNLNRSPGKYCKSSSWMTSHHNPRSGSSSGPHAAQRLVDARRELMAVIKNELDGGGESSNGEANETMGRKLYSITGHGVPNGLLSQLVDAARGWLTHNGVDGPNQQSSLPPHEHATSAFVKISFANVPNSTLLDQTRIRAVNARGAVGHLTSLPSEWERDFEMYMVVMDRMGSRLASLANVPCGADSDHSDEQNPRDEETEIDTDAATGAAGSVIIPSQLKWWDVTIMRGEALPMSLLPSYSLPGSSNAILAGDRKRGGHGGAEAKADPPRLSLEWTKDERGRWNVVLRLQDGGNMRDPISLVFEGHYDAP